MATKEDRLIRVEEKLDYVVKGIDYLTKREEYLDKLIETHSRKLSAQAVYNKIFWLLLTTLLSSVLLISFHLRVM